MVATPRARRALCTIAAIASPTLLVAQTQTPEVRVGGLLPGFKLDGRLDEGMWSAADSIDGLTEVEPVVGRPSASRTVVRILADQNRLVIGIRADDPDPAGIVSFARERDAALTNEDHIKVVLDTYRDGRSGYVFAVNPNGARYDAIVSGQGGTENANWDAVWNAVAVRTPTGWSAEIEIPVRSLQFASGLDSWGFNVQRRIQRFLQTDRWASPVRDFRITQTFRAGRISGLPHFELGLGLQVRPSAVAGSGMPAPHSKREDVGELSLDVTQTLGANTLAALTINTDFAETEVDSRRTNLTRFPIVFPEKRTFFLQGADIFDFGLGLGDDIRPFFSRRIGLLNGAEVPVVAGLKLTGRSNGTNVGALALRTGEVFDPDDPSGRSTDKLLSTVRVSRNLFRESSVGLLASTGDPIGRADSWTAGLDATFRTSRFRGNKNLAAGVWALSTDRADLSGERSAFGSRLEYPNDIWNAALSYKRIGDGFDPSLGFVPRRAAQVFEVTADFIPRPKRPVLGLRVRQLVHEFHPRVITDLNGRWESYRIFMAPINWRLESGDRFEVNFNPTGERLVEPFTIARGVTIPAGTYQWHRIRLEGGLAPKRRFSGQVTYWLGPFYSGSLDELIATFAWKPSSLLNVELNATRNVGRLHEGNFTQEVIGSRVRLNASPNLQFNAYAQYDNETRNFGTNTRVRWTFSPLGDLFVVYNHNLRGDINPSTGLPIASAGSLEPAAMQRWGFASNQLIVKLQYAFRY